MIRKLLIAVLLVSSCLQAIAPAQEAELKQIEKELSSFKSKVNLYLKYPKNKDDYSQAERKRIAQEIRKDALKLGAAVTGMAIIAAGGAAIWKYGPYLKGSDKKVLTTDQTRVTQNIRREVQKIRTSNDKKADAIFTELDLISGGLGSGILYDWHLLTADAQQELSNYSIDSIVRKSGRKPILYKEFNYDTRNDIFSLKSNLIRQIGDIGARFGGSYSVLTYFAKNKPNNALIAIELTLPEIK